LRPLDLGQMPVTWTFDGQDSLPLSSRPPSRDLLAFPPAEAHMALREGSANEWVPGLRFAAPGMTTVRVGMAFAEVFLPPAARKFHERS